MEPKGKKILALIDFDGTITRSDSFRAFLIFALGKRKFYLGLFMNIIPLALYKLKLMPNHKAKGKLLAWYFKGWSNEKFNATCRDFAREILPAMVKEKASQVIKWHIENNHRVIVVSASPQYYLSCWCENYGIEVIGTCFEEKDGIFNYATPNCYGQEKVNRIKSVLNLEDYDEIYAYGDSRGDKEMLELATHKFFRKID
jgi:phosphatidylglycerophosphatase C